MQKRKRTTFYKLIYGQFNSKPSRELGIFYEAYLSLFQGAACGARYAFHLPLNLAEKLLGGNLIADFGYSDVSDSFDTISKSPTSILLSERYK
jgi:hypothetical protein